MIGNKGHKNSGTFDPLIDFTQNPFSRSNVIFINPTGDQPCLQVVQDFQYDFLVLFGLAKKYGMHGCSFHPFYNPTPSFLLWIS